MYNPYNYKAKIKFKTAFIQLCEGKSFENLDLTKEEKIILQTFMKSNSPGKSALQISIETGLPSNLCTDFKKIQRDTRRALKEKRIFRPVISLTEILKYRLEGELWHNIALRGAGYTSIKRVQRFLVAKKAELNEEETKRKAKINATEFQQMSKLLKNSKKIKA